MLRISKLTDYAIVLMTLFANSPAQGTRTARDLASASRLPLPTVSKILKSLCRAGLLASQRGASGGYGLSRPASGISLAHVVEAIEGPLALTECCAVNLKACDVEEGCPMRSQWQVINRAVYKALDELTLDQLTRPLESAVPLGRALSLVRSPA